MKFILHDWVDSRARAILANCHAAMTGGAKLLVVEELVCGPNVPCEAKLGDVNTLARTGGKNRTEREYRDLLRAGGFETQRVLPISGDLALIERHARLATRASRRRHEAHDPPAHAGPVAGARRSVRRERRLQRLLVHVLAHRRGLPERAGSRTRRRFAKS